MKFIKLESVAIKLQGVIADRPSPSWDTLSRAAVDAAYLHLLRAFEPARNSAAPKLAAPKRAAQDRA